MVHLGAGGDRAGSRPARHDVAEIFIPPPANDNNSRRFALALITPPSDSPGFLLRRAFEERGGNPFVGLAASDYGAMMVLFPSPEVRESTMLLFPLSFNGHDISLERPEEGANRFSSNFSSFAQLSATGFPLEHWHEGGIRTVFRSIGSVCCIKPLCLNDLDYSALLLVIKLPDDRGVPPVLLMHDAYNNSSAEVRLREVRTWVEAGPMPASGHFDDVGRSGPASSPCGAQRAPRLSDIDEESVRGSPPPSPAYSPRDSVLELWRRVVARHQAGLAPPRSLDSSGAAFAAEPTPVTATATPTMLWDRVLSRHLAAQFPETGMDKHQWYDTLSVPATPLVQTDDGDAAAAVSGEGGTLAAAGDGLADLSSLSFCAEVHEDAARKQRVCRKRAVDSAFKARRSSRLASKEPDHFVNMLSKAKAVKASRFNLSGGSPRLRAAAVTAGLADGVLGPIPLPRLQALAAACGVDPDAVAANSVPSTSG